jgi:uncharacterized membrane protein
MQTPPNNIVKNVSEPRWHNVAGTVAGKYVKAAAASDPHLRHVVTLYNTIKSVRKDYKAHAAKQAKVTGRATPPLTTSQRTTIHSVNSPNPTPAQKAQAQKSKVASKVNAVNAPHREPTPAESKNADLHAKVWGKFGPQGGPQNAAAKSRVAQKDSDIPF